MLCFGVNQSLHCIICKDDSGRPTRRASDHLTHMAPDVLRVARWCHRHRSHIYVVGRQQTRRSSSMGALVGDNRHALRRDQWQGIPTRRKRIGTAAFGPCFWTMTVQVATAWRHTSTDLTIVLDVIGHQPHGDQRLRHADGSNYAVFVGVQPMTKNSNRKTRHTCPPALRGCVCICLWMAATAR